MYQLTASYAHPADPGAFLKHYREKHVPIAHELPKARFFGWTSCETADGSRPPHFLMTVVHRDPRNHTLAAFASPADPANFAAAGAGIELGEVQTEI